jgi:hypothetical protein
LNPGAEVDSIDAREVALFLPFGRTKERQTPASAGTKRRAEISILRSARAGSGNVQHTAAKCG